MTLGWRGGVYHIWAAPQQPGWCRQCRPSWPPCNLSADTSYPAAPSLLPSPRSPGQTPCGGSQQPETPASMWEWTKNHHFSARVKLCEIIRAVGPTSRNQRHLRRLPLCPVQSNSSKIKTYSGEVPLTHNRETWDFSASEAKEQRAALAPENKQSWWMTQRCWRTFEQRRYLLSERNPKLSLLFTVSLCCLNKTDTDHFWGAYKSSYWSQGYRVCISQLNWNETSYINSWIIYSVLAPILLGLMSSSSPADYRAGSNFCLFSKHTSPV